MKNFIFTVLFVLNSAIFVFGQQYPFPMNEKNYSYPYGISAGNQDNEKIQARFLAWDKTMYRESEDGQLGRIRFDDENYTVSEGIGYGMLIYVYMTNETNDFCQDKFDKLYAYYKKWSNGNGVMNWKIKGFERVESYNGATDADLDVALALCLAAKQWGYSTNYSYAEEAEILLNNIFKKEVGNHTFNEKNLLLLNPGDSWNSIANACYFTIASVGAFSQTQSLFDFSQKNDWDKVYADSHTFLEIAQKGGLWPNWSNWDGTPAMRGNDKSSPDYGWDACRTPWRIAWDYVWYGNESSKKMLGKTIEMMQAKSILNNTKYAGYYANLAADNYDSLKYKSDGGLAAFVGGYACALMVDETQRESFTIYHDKLKSTGAGAYYNQTLQMLYLLMTSGNAANFFDLEGCAPQKIVSPQISSISTKENTLDIVFSKTMKDEINDLSNFTLFIDNEEIEDAFESASISGNMISFVLKNSIDASSFATISYNGTTIVSEQGGILKPVVKYPVVNQNYEVGGSTILADCETPNGTLLGGGWYSYSDGSAQSYKRVAGGANETDTAMYFSYTNVASYAGVGFNILPSENPLDCSGSTGVSFYHKGDACILEAKSVTKRNANYSYQTYDIESHEDWTLVELQWEDIADDFVTSGYVTEVTGLQWKEISGSGEFFIDEVTLIGRTFSPSNVDRNSLYALIISANSEYSRATTKKYPQNAIDDFETSIANAADMYMSQSSTREIIDSVVSDLNSAISTFKSQAYSDKKELMKLIVEATTLQSEAVVGLNKGNYPAEAKEAFDNAIMSAQNESEKAISIIEAKEIVTNLKKAISNFKNSIIKTDVTEYAISFSCYPNPCTNVLNIKSGEEIVSVKLISSNGTISTYLIGQNTASINVSNLPKGLYIVQVKTTISIGNTQLMLK